MRHGCRRHSLCHTTELTGRGHKTVQRSLGITRESVIMTSLGVLLPSLGSVNGTAWQHSSYLYNTREPVSCGICRAPRKMKMWGTLFKEVLSFPSKSVSVCLSVCASLAPPPLHFLSPLCISVSPRAWCFDCYLGSCSLRRGNT